MATRSGLDLTREARKPSDEHSEAEVRVLIVEDHVLVGTSLILLLEAEGMQVDLADCGDLQAIFEHADGFSPDVVLLDQDLGPIGPATPLIAPLVALGAAVVMLTGVTDPYVLAEALELGAVGVLSKAMHSDAVVAAVRKAADGGSVITPFERDERLAQLRRLRRLSGERLKPFAALTPREREVLAALCEGLSACAIAERQFVSVFTVRGHIRSVLMRLGVSSQLAAVALAHRSGWLDAERAISQF